MSSFLSIYWNVPDNVCNNTNVEDYGITVNEGHRFQGDQIVIFYEVQMGLLPHCEDEKVEGYMPAIECKYPKNGGVPQNADFSAHLNKVALDVDLLIPNKTFDGLAIIDYERWRPLYDFNFGSRSVYKKYSIDLVRQKYGINDSSAEQVARYEFNNAAKRFFIETISLAKRLRPLAKWGYWEYPLCNYDAGYDGFTDCWPQFRVYNEQFLDILQVQDALFPRVYFTSQHHNDYDRHLKQTIARLRETLRINMLSYQPKKPVYPYITVEYLNDGVDHFYTAGDLCNSLHLPMLLGANGVIIWSTSSKMTSRCPAIASYVHNMLGPYSKAFLRMAKRCSKQNCNGHGICTNLMFAGKLQRCNFEIPEKVYCKCEDGFYGRNCEEKVLLYKNKVIL